MNDSKHNSYQRQYFDRAYEANARIHSNDSPYVQRHFSRTIEFAGIRPGQSVLEIGAGMGRFTTLLVRHGVNVVAADLSPELMRVLREQHSGIETLVCDAAEVGKHTARKFDCIVGFFMLHHIVDFDGLFLGLRAALKPSGRIIFCEPNAYCALYYLQIAFSRHITWRGDGGVRHMRPKVVLGSLERAGFVDLSFERYGFFPPFAYNRPMGQRVEGVLERIVMIEPVRAFQLFMGCAPR